jgi:hypothetical protein
MFFRTRFARAKKGEVVQISGKARNLNHFFPFLCEQNEHLIQKLKYKRQSAYSPIAFKCQSKSRYSA